jgi:23S rRNA pseudouridine2457 synthase
MSRLILFNKPYGVLSQFTPEGRWQGLKDFISVPGVYAAGRLDADSEGLLILTDDGTLQRQISDPQHKMSKVYCAQVEGVPTRDALLHLSQGIDLGDFVTRAAKVRAIEEPAWLWSRNPPIRYRKAIPTSWLELTITEGKNRQVRRMTAKAGYPTLRLIRWAIGNWSLDGLSPGAWKELHV